MRIFYLTVCMFIIVNDVHVVPTLLSFNVLFIVNNNVYIFMLRLIVFVLWQQFHGKTSTTLNLENLIAIVQHFGKETYLPPCRELDEKISTIRMSVR